MTEQNDGAESIACTEIIYRTLRKQWVDSDKQISAGAFIRRKANAKLPKEAAISVTRRKYTTAKECRLKLQGAVGAASLHVGQVRALDLGIDVGPDPLPEDCGHALILNLPDPELDADRAESYASALKRMARVVSVEFEELEHSERVASGNRPVIASDRASHDKG